MNNNKSNYEFKDNNKNNNSSVKIFPSLDINNNNEKGLKEFEKNINPNKNRKNKSNRYNNINEEIHNNLIESSLFELDNEGAKNPIFMSARLSRVEFETILMINNILESQIIFNRRIRNKKEINVGKSYAGPKKYSTDILQKKIKDEFHHK